MFVKQAFGQLARWRHNAFRPAIVKVIYSSGSLRVESSNSSSLCLTYPHQLSVDTIHCFTRLRRRGSTLVLTGTIAFHCNV